MKFVLVFPYALFKKEPLRCTIMITFVTGKYGSAQDVGINWIMVEKSFTEI